VRRRTRRGAAALAAVAVGALALGGCSAAGDGAGAQLLVTQDFGARPVADLPQPKAASDDTPLALLKRNVPGVRDVPAAGGDRRVTAVGPLAERGATRWSLYVNGVGADADGPTDDLHDDDAVWWDRHGTAATGRVRAVVGSFPAPFSHGPEGKKLPVRIECSPADIPSCQKVQDAMTAAGVFAAQGGLQQALTKETLRIIVGPWAQIRDDDAARQLEAGPRVSGVYAKPSPDGRSIAILDARGAVTRRLGPGSGLIAATRFHDGQPVWIVTAPDVAGVAAVAQALDQGNLKDHFALAVVDGRAVSVPETGTPAAR
jgi:hypothetical protein